MPQMRFETLPFEVLSVIGSFCSPADIVNIAIAYPPLSEAVLPGIYRCIVIDPVPRALLQARTYREAYVSSSEPEPVTATTVHTIAGIKQLLETLATCPHYASKVRSFSACGNIALSDISLIPRVSRALKNLDGLKEFEWTACPELPPSVLSDFPKDHNEVNYELVALTIDLATRSNTMYPHLSLPNLKRLRVRPFLDQKLLTWLKELVSNSHDLSDIELCRFLDTKAEVGSSFTFIGRSDTHRHQEIVPAVSIFFGGSIYRDIRKLKLNHIDTCSDDCRVFADAVNFQNLTELQLVGSGREDEYSHGVLAHITTAAPILEKVEINWDSSARALTEFLRVCCQNAHSMKLTVKTQPKRTIAALAKTCKNVKHLELQFSCDFELSDLTALADLSQIEVLKLPYDHVVESWKVALALKNLKLLELSTKQTAQRANSHRSRFQNGLHTANMGLLTGGIHEQWDSHIRSSLRGRSLLSAVSSNDSLEFFIVDGRTVQLKSTVPSAEVYAW